MTYLVILSLFIMNSLSIVNFAVLRVLFLKPKFIHLVIEMIMLNIVILFCLQIYDVFIMYMWAILFIYNYITIKKFFNALLISSLLVFFYFLSINVISTVDLIIFYPIYQITAFLLLYSLITILLYSVFIFISRKLISLKTIDIFTKLIIKTGAYVFAFLSLSIYMFFLYQKRFGVTISFEIESSMMFSIGIGITLLCYLLFIYYYKFKLLLYEQDKITNRLMSYIERLETQYMDIKRFKHDYHNILLSMEGYISDNNIMGLKNYYYCSLLPSYQQIEKNPYVLDQLGNLKIPVLKSILYHKLNWAIELGLSVVYEQFDIIEHIDLDFMALSRCIGIILDNAIEESLSITNPKIHVSFVQTQSSVLFITKNNCKDNIQSVSQLEQDGFSTKGKDRGHGLHSLKVIIAPYENVMIDTSICNQEFTKIIEIVNKKG